MSGCTQQLEIEIELAWAVNPSEFAEYISELNYSSYATMLPLS